MRIGKMLPLTEVEGPGLRAAIWFQGCSIRCLRCCNPEFFDAKGGDEISPESLATKIASLPVEGVTLLGGEPLDQARELLEFATFLKERSDKGIILFSGFQWEKILDDPVRRNVVELCDLVKAGPFVAAVFPDSRRWIGSKNQSLHFISERYAKLRNLWPPAVNEIEIHLRDEEIVLNGTPNFDEIFFPRDSGNK